MPLLRPGITGFDVACQVDYREFKKAVFTAAQAAGASVVAITEAGVTPSFHQADILLHGRELSVICNRTFPIVAVVQRPIEMSGVQPCDVPELAETISPFGFEVAPTSELTRPLDAGDFELLSKSDRQQAQYWEPLRVSDVVFHWWD
jgi:hypothetical protein